MKPNHYIVTFQNGKTVFATCWDREEAEILAKAVMIKQGFTREIKRIESATRRDITNTDYVA